MRTGLGELGPRHVGFAERTPPPPQVWREPRKAQRARVLREILSTEHPGRAWRVGDDRDMLAGRKDGSWRRHGTGGPAGRAVTATRCEAQRSCPPSIRLPARLPGAPSGVGVCPWVVPWRPLPFYSLREHPASGPVTLAWTTVSQRSELQSPGSEGGAFRYTGRDFVLVPFHGTSSPRFSRRRCCILFLLCVPPPRMSSLWFLLVKTPLSP